ncbi:MAG: nitroreductase [Pseudomonadota bacterium]
MTEGAPPKITPPEFGAPMAPAHPSEEARRLLALRRSTSADMMTEPGPDAATLDAILEIAARVPDHRKLCPFRFIIFRGDARARAGEILARRFAAMTPDAARDRIDAERKRFLRAPVVILVVARLDTAHKTPEWEQTLTNGAVCHNLTLAASAYGFGSNWITEWYAYDREVLTAFGLTPDEKASGFIYIGTASEPPRERQRPNMAEIVAAF